MQCIPIPILRWKKVKSGPFTIIIARTTCQRQQGLQHARDLPENTIVLFMQAPKGGYFHTRNCHFPIDIVLLDKHDRVITMWQAEPNHSRIGPIPNNTSKILEAKAGWAARNSIELNDKLLFLANLG